MPDATHAYLIRPIRPDFLATGLDDREKAVMGRHFGYLQKLHGEGKVLFAGRVAEHGPHVFGICVLAAADEAEARALMMADPAIAEGLMSHELVPFRAAFWPA